VERPTKKNIDQETFELIDELLLEKIPKACIAARYSSLRNLKPDMSMQICSYCPTDTGFSKAKEN